MTWSLVHLAADVLLWALFEKFTDRTSRFERSLLWFVRGLVIVRASVVAAMVLVWAAS